jgi:hypothetical protein
MVGADGTEERLEGVDHVKVHDRYVIIWGNGEKRLLPFEHYVSIAWQV